MKYKKNSGNKFEESRYSEVDLNSDVNEAIEPCLNSSDSTLPQICDGVGVELLKVARRIVQKEVKLIFGNKYESTKVPERFRLGSRDMFISISEIRDPGVLQISIKEVTIGIEGEIPGHDRSSSHTAYELDSRSPMRMMELHLDEDLAPYEPRLANVIKRTYAKGFDELKKTIKERIFARNDAIVNFLFDLFRERLGERASSIMMWPVDAHFGVYVFDERSFESTLERLKASKRPPGSSPLRILSELASSLLGPDDTLASKEVLEDGRAKNYDLSKAPYHQDGPDFLDAELRVIGTTEISVHPVLRDESSVRLTLACPRSLSSEVHEILTAFDTEMTLSALVTGGSKLIAPSSLLSKRSNVRVLCEKITYSNTQQGRIESDPHIRMVLKYNALSQIMELMSVCESVKPGHYSKRFEGFCSAVKQTNNDELLQDLTRELKRLWDEFSSADKIIDMIDSLIKKFR